MMMRVHADEEMFFSGYGLTLAPGVNEISDPEPRLKRLFEAMPGVRILDSVSEGATVAPATPTAPKTVKRRKRRR